MTTSYIPLQQPTSNVVQCYGRPGKIKDTPVQAVVNMLPKSDGRWEKVVSCSRKTDCKGVGIMGWCELEK
jgi:hypothetical protein